jgi:Flp pilus assembly protein protease CpaA
MLTFPWQMFPAVVGLAVLLLAAAMQARLHRVPNSLTFSAILGGWLFAVYLDATHRAVSPGPAILASLASSFAAFIVLLPMYSSNGLGAGCVKAQMAFGAWIGSALPLIPALVLTAGATIGGLLFTVTMALMKFADLPNDGQERIDYRAQIMMTIFASLAVAACWAVSLQA